MAIINDDYILQVSDPITISGDEQEASFVLLENTLDYAGTVRGTVYDTTLLTGDKIVGATVKIFDENGHPVMHTESGEDGQYTLSNVPDGDYLLSASKEGFLMAVDIPITVDSLTQIVQDIALAVDGNTANGTLYGTVTDTVLSNAIEDVYVLLYQLDGGDLTKIAVTMTIEDGEYVIDEVPPGNYSLLFSRNGYYSSESIPVTMTASTSTLKSIQLEPNPDASGGTISGVVKNELGNEIANAFVGLYSAPSDVPESIVAITYTNEDGRYMFGGVVAGEYIVKAKASELI